MNTMESKQSGKKSVGTARASNRKVGEEGEKKPQTVQTAAAVAKEDGSVVKKTESQEKSSEKWSLYEIIRVILIMSTVIILAVLFSLFVLNVQFFSLSGSFRQKGIRKFSIAVMFFEFCVTSYGWYAFIIEHYAWLMTYAFVVLALAILQFILQIVLHSWLAIFNVFQVAYAISIICLAKYPQKQ